MMSPEEAAAFLRGSAARVEPGLSEIVRDVVEAAAIRARGYIGHQQPDWASLSDFTIAQKSLMGFGPPDWQPLERTGQLEASIETQVDGLVGVVGSPDVVAVYQETGTPMARNPIPARPFLAPGLAASVTDGLEAIAAFAETLFRP